ncbi:hypothetical protein WICPIJ_005892 [Wickerhamomyces pijperi]|uniref:Uncharacterized protein n=1 Tax=Wickerhamomyces pijperi TaxID=599730 RepID=A0A9P8TLI1_WICPI|nr:hypothetical protein WICPIJ_005892 [Wickerhamomyces pijperi]
MLRDRSQQSSQRNATANSLKRKAVYNLEDIVHDSSPASSHHHSNNTKHSSINFLSDDSEDDEFYKSSHIQIIDFVVSDNEDETNDLNIFGSNTNKRESLHRVPLQDATNTTHAISTLSLNDKRIPLPSSLSSSNVNLNRNSSSFSGSSIKRHSVHSNSSKRFSILSFGTINNTSILSSEDKDTTSSSASKRFSISSASSSMSNKYKRFSTNSVQSSKSSIGSGSAQSMQSGQSINTGSNSVNPNVVNTATVTTAVATATTATTATDCANSGNTATASTKKNSNIVRSVRKRFSSISVIDSSDDMANLKHKASISSLRPSSNLPPTTTQSFSQSLRQGQAPAGFSANTTTYTTTASILADHQAKRTSTMSSSASTTSFSDQISINSVTPSLRSQRSRFKLSSLFHKSSSSASSTAATSTSTAYADSDAASITTQGTDTESIQTQATQTPSRSVRARSSLNDLRKSMMSFSPSANSLFRTLNGGGNDNSGRKDSIDRGLISLPILNNSGNSASAGAGGSGERRLRGSESVISFGSVISKQQQQHQQ